MKTPDHYTSAKTPIERLPEAYKEGFIIGNIIKYASRAGLKDSFEQDLEKCLHYCQMLMELRAGEVSNDQSSDRIKYFAELLQEPEQTYNQPQVADHPKPNGEVPQLPDGVVIPDGGYQLGSEDVLDKNTDWFWDSLNKEWSKLYGLHGHKVKKLTHPFAYRIYKSEPTTTILRDQPEPVYNQIVGRGTRIGEDPEPRGGITYTFKDGTVQHLVPSSSL